MKNMTTKFLLVSAGLTVAVCAQAQQRVVAPAGQAYTIQSVAPANGTSVTYQWSRDDVVIANETGESYTVPANFAQMANGLDASKTSGTVFQRVARSADCMGGVAMSNTVVVYFCELLVNGVCWARANVDQLNRISPNPWDLGYFYQWNRPGAPLATSGTISWNGTPDNSSEWTSGFPCPADWRLPTKRDFQNLFNGSNPVGGTWITSQARGLPSGVSGRLFGYNTALCTMTDMSGCIFLPAAGYRNEVGGTLTNSSANGYYWSSEQESFISGIYASFTNNSNSPAYGNTKARAFSIRCVMDVN